MVASIENSAFPPAACRHCRNPIASDVIARRGYAQPLLCPHCGAVLHRRKPGGIQRTWALVIAALVLYVPANVLPIMTMDYMGQTQADTIFTGVKALFASGMWIIGLLIFCASITIPLMKLLGLAFLLVTVQRAWKWRLADRTRLYRVIDLIGRWSMLDVFLLSILVALVRLGNIATIVPGYGAYAFAAVVVLTMFAARCFDPRFIWDHGHATASRHLNG